MAGSFSQFSFGDPTQSASRAMPQIAPLHFEMPSAERKKDIRLSMASQLQTTLEVEPMLTLFLKQLRQSLPVSGIEYRHDRLNLNIAVGTGAKHSCSYQLNMADHQYGTIAFVRNKRFAESELHFIESVMDLLVFPLRNALKYHEAIASAMIDPLTGLNNRSAMAMTLTRELENSRRHEAHHISVLMLDVDHFKRINDRYGHLTGDDVLRQVARVLQESVRASDATFRYGGEEFLICLTHSNLPLARMVGERIRMAIEEQVRLPNAQESVTASIGVAHYNGESDWPELVKRADDALYQAKNQGRDRVVAAI